MRVKDTSNSRETHLSAIILSTLMATGLLLFTLSPLNQVSAQTKVYQEDYVKAAFIYNLLKFVTWPEPSANRATDPFTIYVIGKKSIHDILISIVAGEKYAGHPIAVRWDEVYNPQGRFHILFLAADHREQWPRIYSHVRERAILTVGDFDTFCHVGGIINASREGPRLKILLNIKAAKRAGLRIDSKLLRMVTIVKE